jgi:hypothetical protein
LDRRPEDCAVLRAFSGIGASPDPKLIEGAKKEGQMVFYTTMTLDQSKEVIDRFQKKYPFIKPTLFRTGGGPLRYGDRKRPVRSK